MEHRRTGVSARAVRNSRRKGAEFTRVPESKWDFNASAALGKSPVVPGEKHMNHTDNSPVALAVFFSALVMFICWKPEWCGKQVARLFYLICVILPICVLLAGLSILTTNPSFGVPLVIGTLFASRHWYGYMAERREFKRQMKLAEEQIAAREAYEKACREGNSWRLPRY
jgi:hypothetical protein